MNDFHDRPIRPGHIIVYSCRLFNQALLREGEVTAVTAAGIFLTRPFEEFYTRRSLANFPFVPGPLGRVKTKLSDPSHVLVTDLDPAAFWAHYERTWAAIAR